jgi:hypothetical protein
MDQRSNILLHLKEIFHIAVMHSLCRKKKICHLSLVCADLLFDWNLTHRAHSESKRFKANKQTENDMP